MPNASTSFFGWVAFLLEKYGMLFLRGTGMTLLIALTGTATPRTCSARRRPKGSRRFWRVCCKSEYTALSRKTGGRFLYHAGAQNEGDKFVWNFGLEIREEPNKTD